MTDRIEWPRTDARVWALAVIEPHPTSSSVTPARWAEARYATEADLRAAGWVPAGESLRAAVDALTPAARAGEAPCPICADGIHVFPNGGCAECGFRGTERRKARAGEAQRCPAVYNPTGDRCHKEPDHDGWHQGGKGLATVQWDDDEERDPVNGQLVSPRVGEHSTAEYSAEAIAVARAEGVLRVDGNGLGWISGIKPDRPRDPEPAGAGKPWKDCDGTAFGVGDELLGVDGPAPEGKLIRVVREEHGHPIGVETYGADPLEFQMTSRHYRLVPPAPASPAETAGDGPQLAEAKRRWYAGHCAALNAQTVADMSEKAWDPDSLLGRFSLRLVLGEVHRLRASLDAERKARATADVALLDAKAELRAREWERDNARNSEKTAIEALRAVSAAKGELEAQRREATARATSAEEALAAEKERARVAESGERMWREVADGQHQSMVKLLRLDPSTEPSFGDCEAKAQRLTGELSAAVERAEKAEALANTLHEANATVAARADLAEAERDRLADEVMRLMNERSAAPPKPASREALVTKLDEFDRQMLRGHYSDHIAVAFLALSAIVREMVGK